MRAVWMRRGRQAVAAPAAPPTVGLSKWTTHPTISPPASRITRSPLGRQRRPVIWSLGKGGVGGNAEGGGAFLNQCLSAAANVIANSAFTANTAIGGDGGGSSTTTTLGHGGYGEGGGLAYVGNGSLTNTLNLNYDTFNNNPVTGGNGSRGEGPGRPRRQRRAS